MMSLEATRQPASFSARPTDAVPANASCAAPGATSSFASVRRMKGTSLVLLPM
jgi:hypothetical protein